MSLPPGTTGLATLPQLLDQARAHEGNEDWDAAEGVYRRILDAIPDHHGVMGLLGTVLFRSRRLEEALALLDGALASAAPFHWMYNNRGCVLEELGRKAEAIPSYRAAALLDPAAKGPADNLKRLLVQSGRLSPGPRQDRPGCRRILAMTLAPDWWSIARLTSQLASAGFDVAAFCPKDSYLAHSGHVCERHFLQDDNVARELADALTAWNPEIILPGDEFAVHFLHRMAGLDLPAPLLQVITRSCGDPRFYHVVRDKGLTLREAGALGIRHPAQAPAAELGEFTAIHGYPVVIKMSLGMAGLTVRKCADSQAADAAIAELRALAPPAFATQGTLMVQQHLGGYPASFAFAALEGRILDGFAYCPVQTISEFGPASVLERIRHPEIQQAAERLVAHFGFTGLGGFDFMVDAESGAASLLEMNPRVTIAGPLGALFGHDLAAALHAALTGTAAPPATGNHDIAAVFPHEWWRDPHSPYLRHHVTDMPWDDPDLLRHIAATPRPGA
jgi:tetratricopeptide (TPR) repeat protein